MNSLTPTGKTITTVDIERYADDRPIRRLGYILVIAMFGFFGAWSVLAPLGSAALAPGTITVEGYRKTVQHLEGGIVKAIHVRDGDSVEKGQVLLELDDTSSRAQLETLRTTVFGLSPGSPADCRARRQKQHQVPRYPCQRRRQSPRPGSHARPRAILHRPQTLARWRDRHSEGTTPRA